MMVTTVATTWPALVNKAEDTENSHPKDGPQ